MRVRGDELAFQQEVLGASITTVDGRPQGKTLRQKLVEAVVTNNKTSAIKVSPRSLSKKTHIACASESGEESIGRTWAE